VPHPLRPRKECGFAFHLAALRIATFEFAACLKKSRKPGVYAASPTLNSVFDRQRDDEILVSPRSTFGECIVCGVDCSYFSFALRGSDSFRRRVSSSSPVVSVLTDRQIHLRRVAQT